MGKFYKKLNIRIQNLNEKCRAKYGIRKEMYEDIILVLHDGWVIHSSSIGFRSISYSLKMVM
jgi:hypothetical protein